MVIRHRLFILLLLPLLLIVACQREGETVSTAPAYPAVTNDAADNPTNPPPTAATTAPEEPTATAVPTATAADETVYLPITNNPITATLPITNTPTTNIPPTSTPIPATPTPEYPPYTGPPLNRDDIGIQLHLHDEDIRVLLRHLQALDVGWVKVQVSWKVHQPEPNRYDDFLFNELDRLVDGANGNNIKVLLSVSKAPEWSRPTTELDGPPSDYAHFEQFMATLASRYQGQVAAYELWNEPNLQREWNGTPLSAADLVELIRRGAAGVRAADPNALIISAAPATTGINDGITAIDDRVYMRQMLEAGVAAVVDGIGVHPYGWANPPDNSASNPGPAPSHNNHPSFFFSDTLHDYRALLEAHGAADKPLWVTEFGWGSFQGFFDDLSTPAAPPAGAEFMANVSEWQQALYIMRAYELAHGWDWVGPLFLWNLNFGETLGSDYSESGYSLLRADGSRRPAYRALEFRNGE